MGIYWGEWDTPTLAESQVTPGKPAPACNPKPAAVSTAGQHRREAREQASHFPFPSKAQGLEGAMQVTAQISFIPGKAWEETRSSLPILIPKTDLLRRSLSLSLGVSVTHTHTRTHTPSWPPWRDLSLQQSSAVV